MYECVCVFVKKAQLVGSGNRRLHRHCGAQGCYGFSL